jgi:chromosome partitioning protein
LQPAILTFHELVKEGVPKDQLAMAICRILSDGEEDTVRAYMQDAGYAVLPGAIPERIAYREAQNRGRAITETTAKLNAQVDALIDALMKRVTSEIRRGNKCYRRCVSAEKQQISWQTSGA